MTLPSNVQYSCPILWTRAYCVFNWNSCNLLQGISECKNGLVKSFNSFSNYFVRVYGGFSKQVPG